MVFRLTRGPADEAPVRPEPGPATLVVRPEVVRAIAQAADGAGAHETGGPLLGTVERSWAGAGFSSLVSVLGTVAPGPGVDGRRASVRLGSAGDGERAASALRWLRTTTGLDLVHIGDWHVHPGGVCEPSAGDLRTAETVAAASGAPVWITAVAVDRCDRSEDLSVAKHRVRHARKQLVTTEVGFFRLVERALVPLPAWVESDALPRLPPLPWHVADPVRFAAECRLLDAAGYRIAADAAADGLPRLCLRVRRDGSPPVLVVTDLRFPQRAPELRDEHGRRLALGRPWSAERFLVDVVREVLA